MSFSFVYPHALWLLLLLPLLWVFVLYLQPRLRQSQIDTVRVRSQTATTGSRLVWLRLILRSLMLVLLVLALAGTQLIRPVDNLTVVFLIDGSDSVSPAQREQAIEYIDTALQERGDNDRAAIVLFGENALVEWAPTELQELTRLSSTPVSSRTNVEEAIQLGLALLPADSQKRIVLLSDGRENAGQAQETVNLLTARSVPLDVVPLPSASGSDVLVNSLDAPEVAREGQEVPLRVQLNSSINTTGQLQIFGDGELLDTLDIDIEAGSSSVAVDVPAGDTGFHRYEVRLEAQGDAQPVNNRAAAFTTVQGPPRVLLIATDEERSAALQRALEAASVRVEVRSPNQVSADPAALQEYAAVMLVDVLARDVPVALQRALPTYVREQGGSLAMIGGFESFGAGGWRRSPVADALPVQLEPQDTEQRPDLALVLVIDRSGSMSEPAGRGLTKLDLAKEAVYQSSLGLENNDEIGVVGFDTVSNWVLPMQRLPSLADIEQALSAFQADGGTNIRSGIAPSADALAESNAAIKHVILLTDGLADSNYADLIEQMQANGITISVVSIGADANPALEQIAGLGGGRFYRVNALAEVPDIFLSETVLVAGRDIVEGQFTPAIALPAPVVRGVDGLPPLYGYNATEPRTAARTILVTPDDKPLLAQWQFGLGRAVAWTSDFKGQWAQDWTSWSQFPRFVNGFLDELLPPQQTEGIDLRTRTDGAQTIIDLTVQDSDGRPLEAAQIEGRLLDPEDQGSALAFTQVGAGRYRTIVETAEPGVYLVQLAALDSEGQLIGNLSSGIAISYSPEYRLDQRFASSDGISPLLGELAAATGGQETPTPEAVFTSPGQPVGLVQEIALPLLWAALLLWPLDIASRRLLLRWGDLRGAFGRVSGTRRTRTANVPVPAEATVAQLQNARSRVRRTAERPATQTSRSPQVASPATTTSPPAATTPPASPPPATTPAPRQPTVGKASSQPTPKAASTSASSPNSPTAQSTGRHQAPPRTTSQKPPARSQPARSDDALASLLAAKQRARRRSRGQQDENKE